MKSVVYYQKRTRSKRKLTAKLSLNPIKLFCGLLIWVFFMLGSANTVLKVVGDQSILGKLCIWFGEFYLSSTLFNVFVCTALVMFLFCIFSYVVSLSCFGVLENAILLCIFGFVMGQTLGALYLQNGLKGAIFALCTQIPSTVLMGYILIILSKSTMCLSYQVFKNIVLEEKEELAGAIKKHSKVCVYCAVLSLGCFALKVISLFIFLPYIHL